MAALYILDKLSEVAVSSLLEDKMKVVFSRARECDEGFIEALKELSSAFRVSLTKDHRLIAELEAPGQRGDVLKPLEYTREMVAHDSARVMFHAEREAKSIVLNKNSIKVVPPVLVSC
ncbi:hypothetical protein Tco_0053932 [Tanacetum coccineum]